MIRFSTAEMLTNLGHAVEEAGDAGEALATLEQGGFDVIVTDLALPGMSGEELAQRAAERRPDLRVVYATGYELSARARGPDGVAGAVVLQKPYDQKSIDAALVAACPRPDARGQT